MKSSLLIIIFSLINLHCWSQNKYIEVEVEDTISLKPIQFQYLVKIEGDQTEPEETHNTNENVKKVETQLEELRQFLIASGYVPESIKDLDYGINNYNIYVHKGFTVQIQSEEELRTLKKDLQQLPFISAHLGEIQYEDKIKREEQLIKRLMENAQRKANFIAGTSEMRGKKLQIIEVTQLLYDDPSLYYSTATIRNQRKVIARSNKGILSLVLKVKFVVK